MPTNRKQNIDDIYSIEANFLSTSPSNATTIKPLPNGTTKNNDVEDLTTTKNNSRRSSNKPRPNSKTKKTVSNRAATTTTSIRKKRQRPAQQKKKKPNEGSDTVVVAPVPDPPVSLINLLRKDKKVLNYFTALQQNLDRDVQKWKEKASEYRSELRKRRRRGDVLEDLDDGDQHPLRTIHVSKRGIGRDEDVDGGDESSLDMVIDDLNVDKDVCVNGREEGNAHLEQLPHGGESLHTEVGITHQTASDDDVDVDDYDNGHSILNKKEPLETKSRSSEKKQNISKLDQHENFVDRIGMEEAVSITDEMANELLNMTSSSSSSSSVSHNKPMVRTREAIDCHVENQLSQRREIRREVLMQLIEAYENLQKLGVWLVDINVSKDEVIETQETEKINDANATNDGDKVLTGRKNEVIPDDDSSYSSGDDGFLFNRTLNKSKKDAVVFTENNDVTTTQFKRPPLCSFTRRNDTVVVTDLMRAMRSFIRLPATGMKNGDSGTDAICLQPFMGSDLIPCCYAYPGKQYACSEDKISTDHRIETIPVDGPSSSLDELPHPAVSGFRLVCRSLMVLDTYASPNSPFVVKGEWEKLFEDASNTSTQVNENDDNNYQRRAMLEQICIGMRNRNITSMLLQSLDGEISRYWAVADRAIRETTTVLINEQVDRSDDDDLSDSSCGMNAPLNDNDLTPNKDAEVFSSKSQNRLFSLAERVCHARLASFLYQYRSDIQEAGRLVIEYILSTCPSPTIEDYPRYPPTMSMCILEALLSRITDGISLRKDADSGSSSLSYSWFFIFLQKIAAMPSSEGTDGGSNLNQPLLYTTLMFNVRAAANIWKERQSSKDRRVRDISRVEFAAYKRLLQSESEWLHQKDSAMHCDSITKITNTMEVIEKARQYLLPDQSEINQRCLSTPLSGFDGKMLEAYISLQSSLLLKGDHELAVNICRDALSRYDETCSWNAAFTHTLPPVIMTCFKVHTALQSRIWESYRLKAAETGDRGDYQLALSRANDDHDISCEVDKMIKMLIDEEKYATPTARIVPVSTMLRCCLILSDGMRANYITKLSLRNPSKSRAIRVDEQQMIIDIGEYPSVRVINLKSRPDRWNNFMIQAQREQLLAVHAVATAEECQDLPQGKDRLFWGSYAYDGTNIGQLGFEKRMHPYLGSKQALTDLVATYWSPKELKAFDSLARDDVEKVLMNPSERACALSHLMSWIGVKRSLHCKVESNHNGKLGERTKDYHSLRMLKISGFARGASIFLENSNISPSPVCIILEDDAVLVDRFSDRLALLLDELPRDFHFCSLGYGRPKNAPMIKYSSQIGIPTCIWYLTGYIISLAGANHLLESLPVKGPVDSWIGMKMMATWDNSFGHRIGIASNTKTQINRNMLPDKKDLKKIMKFRCFAALTPLCSQKVGASTSTSTTDKKRWRQRDTDIIYSGHGWTRR